jgi:hypothetical protein
MRYRAACHCVGDLAGEAGALQRDGAKHSLALMRIGWGAAAGNEHQ